MQHHNDTAAQSLARERAWLRDEKYGGVESAAYRHDCARLEAGEPLAYLIGSIPFLGCSISLDSRPLIPRPETEYWVERAITELGEKRTQHGQRPLQVLDLCAGSGCIGVAVLAALPHVRGALGETDPHHHPTIAANVARNEIDPARTRIFGGDLFASISGTYDAILANPPYLDPARAARAAASVTTYEPSGALWGGHGGTALIERILSAAPAHLASSGALYLEHEPEQAAVVEAAAASAGRYGACESRRDQYGTVRYTRLARDSSRRCATIHP